jgi:hypothetical protein
MADQKQLSDHDKAEILNTLHGVAFILDSRSYDRLGEVFSADMHFENPGRLTANGLEEVIAAFKKVAAPGLSHHITNVVITPDASGTVHAICKALTMRADKSINAAEYRDVLKKTKDGWRISSRNIRTLA